MGKLSKWIILAAMLPTFALAQPPEEVPPPPPDATAPEQPATPAASAPVTVAPDNTAPPIPVAEPVKAPEAPKAEDKTIKGITIAPAVGVYPIGFDSYNITGSEADKYFFELKPSIGLSTSLKTGTGKTVDFEVGYGLEWREYYNKSTTMRDFGHALSGAVTVPLNDRLTLSFPGEFDYFFKVGADDEVDSGITLLALPKLTYKVSSEFSVKAEYNLEYAQSLDAVVTSDSANSNSDPFPDIEDMRFGNFGSTVDPSTDPNAVSQKVFEAINHLIVGATWTPIKGTKLGFDYRYTIKDFSNDDNREYHAHWFIPSISQDMPWPGGSVSLKNDTRLRIYDYKKSKADSSVTAQNFRNRTTISATQAVNDYISFEGYFRISFRGSNDNNYEVIDNDRHFYLGMNFTF